MPNLDLINAEVLTPEGLTNDRVSMWDGRIVADPIGRAIDLNGFLVLPGIIDVHGDGFERHLAPRRGAMKQLAEGLVSVEAELAANGISTAMLAQFVSWEGGLRGAEFAGQVFDAIRDTARDLITDMRPQLRLETHLTDLFEDLPALIARWKVPYVVFNDHLPHDRLAEGRKPPRLVGQALKAGRNPDAHFDLLMSLHARTPHVAPALDRLCAVLLEQGIRLGSHDDHTSADRAIWHRRGVRIAEFPETLDAAEAAKAQGDFVILGAPNIVRGGSHKGNVSALDLIAMGLCDAIASDYHYPSPRRAALLLVQSGLLDLAAAWALVSSGPARVLGLTDRGRLEPGLRADMVILDRGTKRVGATVSAGRFSYLAGDVAERLL